MTSKPDARPDDRKRKNTWQHLSIDSPALDTGEVGTEFLMNLMYMFAGVYTTSNTMTRLKKLQWNIFPFLAHCQCLQYIILEFVLRRDSFINLITTVLQMAMFLVNSATFYRSRRLGSVSRDIPRKTQRAAFIWGIAVCLVFLALWVWKWISQPVPGEYAVIIPALLFLTPVCVYQLVMILLLVGQFRRFNASLIKHLDATIQGNDADVVHNELVKGNEVSFDYFRKHIAVPFLPFFFCLIIIIALGLVSLYIFDPATDPNDNRFMVISVAYLLMVFLTCAICLFVFVEVDQKAYYLHMKMLKNRTMQKADLACLLIVYEHLIPRAEILGVQVTTGRVVALMIPVVTAVLPKAFNALADYSKSH